MKGIVKTDPRVKLFLFLVTCVYVMNFTQVVFFMIIGSFIALLLILNGEVVFGIKNYIIYIIVLLGVYFSKNESTGVLSGIILAVCGFLMIMLPIIMSFFLVFKTTTVSQFMSAFQKMRLPVKFIIPFAVMFRFIPTVQETWENISMAMAFRGISLSLLGVIRHPVRSIERALIPLLFSATAVIEELAAAALARGLDSDKDRSCMTDVRMSILDYIFLMVVLVLAGLMIYGNLR